MLIHFESKRRWNITILTTRHSLVEHPTGLGASPCTCRSPIFATPVDDVKGSLVPWYSKHSATEERFSGNNRPTLRCRDFLRKICRFSRRTHQMDPRRHGNVTYDEPPPPYECPQRAELLGSPMHELPDRHIPTHELEDHHRVIELETSMKQSSHYLFPIEPRQTSYSFSNEADEHGTTADGLVIQPSEPDDGPIPLWIPNSQQTFASASSMIRSGQSQNSSPISPVTPVIEGNHLFQAHSDGNIAAGTIPFLENVPLYKSHWLKSHLVDVECNHAPRISLPTPLEKSPLESLLRLAQQSETEPLHVRGDEHLRSAVPLMFTSHGSYIPNSNALLAWGDCLPGPVTQQQDTTKILLNDYADCEHLERRHYGLSGQVAIQHVDARQPESTTKQSGSSQTDHSLIAKQRPPLNYIELHDHQDPELYTDLRANGAEYPLEYCSQCNKTFSGKYRKGNLRRHALAFHNPLASVVGKACRVCKKAYKRKDATRKHEWKKHQILDAKPKKRAR